MNKQHGITAENLLASLPQVLLNDEKTAALAVAVAEVLTARVNEISALSIYSRIDELPEELLDILAYDFKVDWWSSDYSIDEKRRTLKSSWLVHKRLGTRYAFEEALQGIYTEVDVAEWYEYGGQPFHFRLHISMGDEPFDQKKHKAVLARARFYKNLRSHLDAVAYTIATEFYEPAGSALLHSLRISTHIPDYGSAIDLNGWKLLDGTWPLSQQHIGIFIPRIGIATKLPENDKVALAVSYSGIKAKTVERLCDANISSKIALQERETADYSLTLGMGASNGYNLSGTLTRDNMWRLDGSYTLGGQKKLNAAITKEDI